MRRRVAEACRAHVSLREVLLGGEMDAVAADIERLRTIGELMEKQSRVASWAARTVTAPVLAAAGVSALRYAILSALGAAFLYYGLKAV